MPQISAFARAIYSDENIDNRMRAVDGDTETYCTINCAVRDENIGIRLYGFDFSGFPANGLVRFGDGVKPIEYTVRGCPGVGSTVKTQLQKF